MEQENKQFRIYKIQSLLDGKVYIGQTSQPIRARLQTHVSYSNRGCPRLYNALVKHGLDSFNVECVERHSSYSLTLERERYWIRWFRSNELEFGYNLTLGGDGAFGAKRSEEYKRKLSEKMKGHTLNVGRKHTDEARINMSAGQLGNQNSRGSKMSEESKQKMAAAKLGNNWNVGRKASDECRRKIGEANSRRVIKPETKQKFTERMRLLHEQRKKKPTDNG